MPMNGQRYSRLDPQRIAETALAISARLRAAFPESGIGLVSQELAALSGETAAKVSAIARAHWPVRIGAWTVSAVIGLGTIVLPTFLRIRTEVDGISDLMQGIEAAVNNFIFLGAALWFLFGLEQRIKRRAALSALHELRSIAHIIDLHQLAKDPETVGIGRVTTQAGLSRGDMAAYLDYCSELLSVVSKLAALYAQGMSDGEVLSAVNDVEELSSSLSSKIWQKIMILDVLAVGLGDGRLSAVPDPAMDGGDQGG